MAKIHFSISFGLVHAPVCLEAAARPQSISYKQVAPDGGAVKQKLVSATTGEEIDRKDLRRGIEMDDGSLVVIDEAELARIEPASSKTIAIERFIPGLDPMYFAASYYVSPKDAGANKAYNLLFAVLKKSGKMAIGKALMFGSEGLVAVRAYNDGLVLHRLYWPSEVRAVREHKADTSALDQKELKMATALVDMLSEEHAELEGRQNEYLLLEQALVEAKLNGDEFNGTKPAAPDMMALMEESIQLARSKNGGIQLVEAAPPKTRSRRKPAASAETISKPVIPSVETTGLLKQILAGLDEVGA
jgi:DNA end-binding protein Ku